MKRKTLSAILILWLIGLAACQRKEDKTVSPGNDTAVNREQNKTLAADGEDLLVEARTLAPEKFEHFFTVNGSLEAIQEAFISPEINGQIKGVHVQEGQRVKSGDLLISLNADILRNTLAEVKSSLDLVRTIFLKRQELWDKKIGSEIQYLEAKSNYKAMTNRLKSLEAQLELAQIKAPFSGIVDKIFQKTGELASPGTQLMRLINLEKIRVNAEVAETYLGKINRGDRIELQFPTYPDWKMEAAISRIGQVVSEKNRTVLVQVVLDNQQEKLKPNMMVSLRFRDFFNPSALVVPSMVIKNDLDGNYLYIIGREAGKTVARKQYVTTGLTEGNRTMIVGGLSAGQQVIISGFNLAKNGLPVTIKA